MALIKATPKNIDEITTLPGRNVLMFTATWCSGCKAMHPIIDRKVKECPEITFVDVPAPTFPGLCDLFEVRTLPVYVLREDGKTIEVKTGAMSSAQFGEFINQSSRS